MNHIKVKIIYDDDREIITRKFHNVKINREESNDVAYLSLETVLSDSDYHDQIVQSALRELNTWRNRYNQYSEFQPIFLAIDQVTRATA